MNGATGTAPFLGTVIATVGGGPFAATEAAAVATLGQTLGQRLLRAHGLGPSMRRRFRIVLRCVTGEGQEHWVWGPPVREAEGWHWSFRPIVVVRGFMVTGLKLADDHGYVLSERALTLARMLRPRDTVALDYDLEVPSIFELRNDCAITAPCERLIVAHHLGHARASAYAARGGLGGAGRGDAH